MILSRIQKWCLLLAGTLIVGSPAVTQAYVLEGRHILELMTEKLGTAQRLTASQSVIVYRNGVRESGEIIRETVMYRFPDGFRGECVSDNTRRIHVSASGSVLTAINEKTVTSGTTRFDRYKDLLLYRTREVLEKELSASGVDIRVSSLGRFEGKIAYVVGAQYPDETVPQVWVDKETFQPIRWLMVDGAAQGAADVLEVRYSQWRRTEKIWYPMQLAFYQDGVLVREIVVEGVNVDAPLPDGLFDIEQLKSRYPVEIVPPAVDLDELTEEQETINKFEERYKGNP